MINNKHIYLVATYYQKPKNPKMTSIKGYMKDPANIRWDESMTVTRGVKRKDMHAQVVLDLTTKQVERNSFDTGKSFDEVFRYFITNYHKDLVPVMAQIDPEYLAKVAGMIEADLQALQPAGEAVASEPVIQDAEIVSETVQAQ